MSGPDAVLRPAPPQYTELLDNIVQPDRPWLETGGFEPLSHYMFGQIPFSAWRQRGKDRFYIAYMSGTGIAKEFNTWFNEEASLTTASSRDSLTLPRPPGAYLQAFPAALLEDLWQLHLGAEQYLAREKNVMRQPMRKSFEEYLAVSIQRHMDYIRSLPFWPLRGAYGFFVRRHHMANRAVEQQASSSKRRSKGSPFRIS